MMINIYDTANQLAREITETAEFKELTAALTALKEDQAAYACYQKIRQAQKTVQEKQMAQQEISKDELTELTNLSSEADKYEALRHLMETEYRVNMMLNDIAKTLYSPLNTLYDL